jgi:hypothetical protein
MTTVWKRRSIIFGIWGALIVTLTILGVWLIAPWFLILFPILLSIPVGILTFLMLNDPNEEEDEETQKLLESIYELETMLEDNTQVIKDYEEIFDAQLVELPCVCGGNTFKGLFTPNTDNEVQCERCKNTYRVTINYDTVLLSEPMDQKIIDKTLDNL